MRTRYTSKSQLLEKLEAERKKNEEFLERLKYLREWSFRVVQENKVLEQYITRLEKYIEEDYES